MLVVLDVASGPSRHRKIWLRPGQTVQIGRTEAADFVLDADASLSGRHFSVECGADSCRLRDLNSRNGTFLNGRRVEVADLCDGDVVRAGETVFAVRVEFEPDGPNVLKKPIVERREISTGLEEAEQAVAPPQLWRSGDIKAASGTPPLGPATGELLKRVVVEIQSDRARQRRVWLRAGERLTVGRTDAADLALPHDVRLSQRHFILQADPHTCRVRDLESANGTFLNGIKIAAATLRDGDTLVAGETTFVVHLEGGSTVEERHIEVVRPTAEGGLPGGAAGGLRHRSGATASLRYAKYPCRSSLWLYRGADSRFDIATVAGRLLLAGPGYIVGAPEILEQQPDAPPAERTMQLGTAIPPGSPVVVGPLKEKEAAPLLDRTWGKDAVACVFSRLAPEEFKGRMHLFSSGDSPFTAARYNPELACLRPKALADVLANAEPAIVTEFVRGIDAVLLEIHGGERWGLFGRPDFEAALRKTGFSAVPAWEL